MTVYDGLGNERLYLNESVKNLIKEAWNDVSEAYGNKKLCDFYGYKGSLPFNYCVMIPYEVSDALIMTELMAEVIEKEAVAIYLGEMNLNYQRQFTDFLAGFCHGSDLRIWSSGACLIVWKEQF